MSVSPPLWTLGPIAVRRRPMRPFTDGPDAVERHSGTHAELRRSSRTGRPSDPAGRHGGLRAFLLETLGDRLAGQP